MTACGLDFGTSNSAIGVVRDGKAMLAPVEGDNTLLPSAVFFDQETKGRVLLGEAAIAAYVDHTEGRQRYCENTSAMSISASPRR